MSRPVLIMAGGTGGHVFPALAVARELETRGIPVVWLGSKAGMEERIVTEAGISLETLPISGLRGKGLLTLLLLPMRLLRAILQAWCILRRIKPRVVLGMGGFVAGPGGLASWLVRIPLVIHEQNAIPGLTNRFLAHLAKRTLEAVPGSFRNAAEHTGNPVRQEICQVAEPDARFISRGKSLRLLIIGGSLGATALNEIMPASLAILKDKIDFQVKHQSGAKHIESARKAYTAAEVDAELSAFIADMPNAYAWADLVICRAGAMTIAELAASGVGSILVPYPFAVDDHQTYNSLFLVNADAAILIQQCDLSSKSLAEILHSLAKDRPRLLAMANAARRLAKPNATRAVADVCLEVAG